MAWQLTEDLETFLTTAGGFLRARSAANTIMLTATGRAGHRVVANVLALCRARAAVGR